MIEISQDSITMTIPGIPVQKQRHRFARKTGHAYDPNRDAEAVVIGRMNVPEDFVPWDGPVLVESMIFVFPRPKSHYGTRKNAHVIKKSAPKYADSILKDIDNLEKFYLDAMNGVVYMSDKQIVCVREKWKIWCNEGEIPHVLIKMRRLSHSFTT